jgi:hypothetical protein
VEHEVLEESYAIEMKGVVVFVEAGPTKKRGSSAEFVGSRK